METKNVFCPHCQSQLDTPVSLEGKEVQCPICKKNFTVTFQPESENNDQPDINPPQEYKAQQFSQHSAQSDPSASLSKKENPVRIAKNEKASRPLVTRTLLLWIVGGCALLLLVLNVLLGLSLFIQQTNVERLEKRIQGLQMVVNNGLESTRDSQTKMAKDIKTLASNTTYKPVTGYKIINYTWEYSALMEREFREALSAGFEPAGYLCQNSIKGGMFLFVKRAK